MVYLKKHMVLYIRHQYKWYCLHILHNTDCDRFVHLHKLDCIHHYTDNLFHNIMDNRLDSGQLFHPNTHR